MTTRRGRISEGLGENRNGIFAMIGGDFMFAQRDRPQNKFRVVRWLPAERLQSIRGLRQRTVWSGS